MAMPGRTMRLGDTLVAARLITPRQLELALESQQKTGGRLGEVLVQLGFVTEFDMCNTLADQLGYPFISNPEAQLETGVSALVSEALARKYSAVPLKFDGNSLVVAMSDPLNLLAIEDLSLQSGRRIKPAISPDKAVKRALLKAYGLAGSAPGEGRPGGPGAPGGPGGSGAGADGHGTGSRAYDLDEADDSGVVKLVNNLVAQALSNRATDIHIEPGEYQIRVRYRVDGLLQEVAPLARSLALPVISRIKIMSGMDIAERRAPQDGRIEVDLQGRRLDLRVNAVPTVFGEKLAIRILDRSAALLGLGELGMEPDVAGSIRTMLARPNGMFLVTGPTGSGKTTTLMAALGELNKADRHIITVEDPVEYYLPGVNQVQVNTKAGLTFAAGLRAFLRQDPDVMMVGEIRDGETADIAVRAALTGHMVLSTLHTNQAAGAPGRLTDMGVEPFLLASSLAGILAQRLVRRLCPRCRAPYEVTPADPDFPLLAAEGLDGVTLYRSEGCGHCDHTGYTGRISLVELLPVTAEIRACMTRRATAAELQAEACRAGMRTIWQDGLLKARAGETTLDQVKRVAFAEG
ncbi:MAG: ral secretory pathway protein [Symbiobacteriaceae bacterium]|jgi:type IV pilus assembly protein PilB|nr:ral secretory pathway protein [Symbiobacteriaceae bacterium]